MPVAELVEVAKLVTKEVLDEAPAAAIVEVAKLVQKEVTGDGPVAGLGEVEKLVKKEVVEEVPVAAPKMAWCPHCTPVAMQWQVPMTHDAHFLDPSPVIQEQAPMPPVVQIAVGDAPAVSQSQAPMAREVQKPVEVPQAQYASPHKPVEVTHMQ